MGLFGNMFGKKEEATPVTAAAETTGTPVSMPAGGGMLNLQKNDILNLSKAAPTLNRVRVAAGWDMVSRGADYDLDLCAYLLDGAGKLVKKINSCVYFGDKKSEGIHLDKDNLTGAGDGDDENIYVTLSKIPESVQKIVFAVVIYNPGFSQNFSGVKNAYVRLVDSDRQDAEICRYNLSADGGKNTAVIVAELYRDGGAWNFKAIGEYMKASINSLKGQF